MEKCSKCKIKYPQGYCAPVMTSRGTTVVCGICALEISNQVLGDDRKEFYGKAAESLRQAAIKYRKGLPPQSN